MWKLASVVVALMASSCGLQKTAEQLTAKHVLVGTLLATPAVSVQSVTSPSTTSAYSYFGIRDDGATDVTPSPLTGATVSVAQEGGSTTALDEVGSGNYGKTGTLTYQPGATYEFNVTYQGEVFQGRVENVPSAERIDALHPAAGFLELNANSELVLTRPASDDRPIGFVTVVPVSSDGQRGTPTYSNAPTKPVEFLKLVALPGAWKTDTVTIPGTAFPNVAQNYLVIFQSVKLGGPESPNLFSGSALLAGTADIGLVRTNSL